MTEPNTEARPTGTAPLAGTQYDRRRRNSLSVTGEQRIVRRVELAFAPLHKAALGVAAGVVFGGIIALLTLLDLALDPRHQMPLVLLSQYFFGYTVSPFGALIGGAWGSVVGFVAGWFVAFSRNAVMALWVIYFRARAEWQRSHDFLDYI